MSRVNGIFQRSGTARGLHAGGMGGGGISLPRTAQDRRKGVPVAIPGTPPPGRSALDEKMRAPAPEKSWWEA